ncbi:MAG: NAD-dependent epimerase/dehydratase family protein [Acidobacteria bacterium]|nr:NAD-dependent epimerase/dehydratase family protein [Acidobacteriota bacterium]
MCQTQQQSAFQTISTNHGTLPPSEMTHVPEDYLGAPDPMDFRSAYGERKRAAELLCVLYAKESGLQAKIARYFAFVGPYLPLDVHFAVGNFIRDGICAGPVEMNGDARPYRSYLYAADLAIWLWTILFRGNSCRPYNVGSEEDITISALARTVAGVFEPKVDVHRAKPALTGKPAERYVPLTQKAASELELQQRIALQEAIRRTIQWYSRASTK